MTPVLVKNSTGNEKPKNPTPVLIDSTYYGLYGPDPWPLVRFKPRVSRVQISPHAAPRRKAF